MVFNIFMVFNILYYKIFLYYIMGVGRKRTRSRRRRTMGGHQKPLTQDEIDALIREYLDNHDAGRVIPKKGKTSSRRKTKCRKTRKRSGGRVGGGGDSGDGYFGSYEDDHDSRNSGGDSGDGYFDGPEYEVPVGDTLGKETQKQVKSQRRSMGWRERLKQRYSQWRKTRKENRDRERYLRKNRQHEERIRDIVTARGSGYKLYNKKTRSMRK